MSDKKNDDDKVIFNRVKNKLWSSVFEKQNI